MASLVYELSCVLILVWFEVTTPHWFQIEYDALAEGKVQNHQTASQESLGDIINYIEAVEGGSISDSQTGF